MCAEDQMCEEDGRAGGAMMRPHRRERLMGWTEYRTGGQFSAREGPQLQQFLLKKGV